MGTATTGSDLKPHHQLRGGVCVGGRALLPFLAGILVLILKFPPSEPEGTQRSTRMESVR